MVERNDRSAIASFFTEGSLLAGQRVVLDDDAARHVKVRRLETGNPVRLLNGRGLVGWGHLAEAGKRQATVELTRVLETPRSTTLDVIVPIADRDRMLLAAEKCVELQVTGWRPTYFARSRSVSPRGEGTKFGGKVLARMRSALEQSGGAWLPATHMDAEWPDIIEAIPHEWSRILLDVDGTPLPPMIGNESVAIAVGPEGGLEPREKAAAEQRGWRLASLGSSTLRFETALIAAVAIVRAMQQSGRS
jgi:16S rRNA (uracil1498-N3)-methyltransferase